MSVLVRNVELEGRRCDVRVVDTRVTEVGVGLDLRGAEPVEGHGGALVPGLTDHHLHLLALAADLRSVRCGPPVVRDATTLAAALATARLDEHGWIRGTGYHEDVAGLLTADDLDRLHGRHPVRLQHRSGAVWFLNSRAVDATALATADHPGIERDEQGRPTGRLWRADSWLRSRLPPAQPPDLADVGRRLTGFGITSVTDATPRLDQAGIDLVQRAGLPQHVRFLGAPLDGRTGVRAGPWKIVLADSGLPELAALVAEIHNAHRARRPVAVHCVTVEALFLLIAALGEAGVLPGDRIEHAAVVPAEALPLIRALGVRVVTQPGFLQDRGDMYALETPVEERGDLYRCRSLLESGVPLALSSDAPFGPLDPWRVMLSAVRREVPGGEVLGQDERITPRQALTAYLTPPDDPGGRPTRIVPGAAADLVLLHVPLAEALAAPAAELVRRVWIDGTLYQEETTGAPSRLTT